MKQSCRAPGSSADFDILWPTAGCMWDPGNIWQIWIWNPALIWTNRPGYFLLLLLSMTALWMRNAYAHVTIWVGSGRHAGFHPTITGFLESCACQVRGFVLFNSAIWAQAFVVLKGCSCGEQVWVAQKSWRGQLQKVGVPGFHPAWCWLRHQDAP